MINERTFLKLPTNFQNLCKIYPPSVNDVVGNEHFSQYKVALTLSQEEINDLLFGYERNSEQNLNATLTPLEFLLNNCYHNKDFQQITRDAFQFFTHSNIDFIWKEKKIVFGQFQEILSTVKSIEEIKDIPCLNEDNFFDFQNELRLSMGENKVEKPPENEDIRITRMKAKARYRDKIKAKKGQGLSLGTSLAAICCMGIGITPLNIGELSYGALTTLTRTYQEKEKYDLDIRSLLAGADSKKIKPKYWIRNFED